MKQTTPDVQLPADLPHSFVVRMWQEVPGMWRGTIRHVQSEKQHGFTKLDQAVRFIEQETTLRERPSASVPSTSPAARPRPGLDFKINRRSKTMLALAGFIVLAALILVLSITGVRLDALTAFMGH